MHNKELRKLKDLPQNAQNLLFADEDNPKLKLENIDLKRCMLIRIGIQSGEFRGCTFHQCIFDDCYFRKAKFYNVDFTGSFFKDCNLERASFESTRFRYVRFLRCHLNYTEILQSLPGESRIAIHLIRSLRQNAIQMGEKHIADKLLAKQIEFEKIEFKNGFWAASSYYKERYDLLSRLISGLKFLSLIISGWIWGHGLKIKNLLVCGISVIGIFAFIIFKFGSYAINGNSGTPINLTLAQSLYLSTITFTTLGYGDFTPTSIGAYFICGIESFLGIVFLGFLAATVYRKYAK